MRLLTRLLVLGICLSTHGLAVPAEQESACQALSGLPRLTILEARLRSIGEGTRPHCHVRGLISPAIHYHLQLPLPTDWNGRFLKLGDGGTDGDLDFADDRVAQGYAVANSNMGHDAGSEPGASFAFNNRQAEIDFGYRAVHLTTNAAKTLIQAYYGEKPRYSYFEGCSTGGREALIEAQRFPYDFDGIVAGSPGIYYQRSASNHLWLVQRVFRNNLAGNLAFDRDGDGVPESLTKVNLLKEAVLAKCDGYDGVRDGIIDDPLACDFRPQADLADRMCPGDVNADACLTTQQLQTIQDVYAGAHDSKGVRILKGKPFGTEYMWASDILPHAGNGMVPPRLRFMGDHVNYFFYEEDPGVAMPRIADLSLVPDRRRQPPEYAWWQFNVDDVTAGKGDLMMSITDPTDPDLTRFLIRQGGKLIIYHGWGDGGAHPEPTLDYYKEAVGATFGGDTQAAREKARLFMVPGMSHCGGGPGPNEWDRLVPIVDWVENGNAPDYLVATHSTDGRVENERKICAYPERAVYTGPAGGQDDPANWVHQNFTCRQD